VIRTLAILIAAVFAFNAMPALAQSSSSDKSGSSSSGSMDKSGKKCVEEEVFEEVRRQGRLDEVTQFGVRALFQLGSDPD
jgi:hypothetical protein